MALFLLQTSFLFLDFYSQVNDLQAEMSKLQSQQVSLQLEHKELKKKQRRSERYYTNKQTKDTGSQNDSIQEDDVEMVGDVSLQDEFTTEDPSEEGKPSRLCQYAPISTKAHFIGP